MKGEALEAEAERLKGEMKALDRMIASIENRLTLNVLTDEGLLPNYAFPEQGVTLRSVITRRRETKPAVKGVMQAARGPGRAPVPVVPWAHLLRGAISGRPRR